MKRLARAEDLPREIYDILIELADLRRMPAEIFDLLKQLAWLQFRAEAAAPTTSPGTIGAFSEWSAQVTPDAGNRRYRVARKRILSRIRRVADYAWEVVNDQPTEYGPRCPSCGTGQRRQARHCDQCGSPLEAAS